MKQTQSGWQSAVKDSDGKVYVGSEINSTTSSSGGSTSTTGRAEVGGSPTKNGKATITINDTTGAVTITCS